MDVKRTQKCFCCQSSTDLLSVLHASHGAWRATLYPHGVSLRGRGPVALPRVGAALLRSGPRGGPLLLRGIGVRSSVRLSADLPELVHWARRLEGKRGSVGHDCELRACRAVPATGAHPT